MVSKAARQGWCSTSSQKHHNQYPRGFRAAAEVGEPPARARARARARWRGRAHGSGSTRLQRGDCVRARALGGGGAEGGRDGRSTSTTGAAPRVKVVEKDAASCSSIERNEEEEEEERRKLEREIEAAVEEEVSFGDTMSLWITNIIQMYGDGTSADGAPVAEGKLDDLTGRPLFTALYDYFQRSGGIYKLAFGPKTFMVVSDPVIARHILREQPFNYDKGVLAEILEPIMGKGLIPADIETWKKRRRAIVPGFHKAWLNRMVEEFVNCTDALVSELEAKCATDEGRGGEVVDMEEKFCSVSLDIIGKCVFNYDFGSVTSESPVIKAVYKTLREAEHRSTFYFPYWNIPGASLVVPRQREFQRDLRIINDSLNELIDQANATRCESDLADLEARDYDKVKDPSMLRFLVDLRGEEATDKQLRDDLMTMLVAGHETTAAVLTWAAFCLSQSPDVLSKLRAEVDAVLGGRTHMNTDDIRSLKYTRYTVAESLRMYPEPPILIRRCLKEDVLPRGSTDVNVKLLKGMDIFISVWNLHRSPDLWEEPDRFNPDRWEEEFRNDKVEGWSGYRPDLLTGLYPNEIASDFAFIPFGGGMRKCVGDQFALMEATVVLARFVQAFDFELVGAAEDVGMVTGATIHTENGLKMRLRRRKTAALTS